MATKTSVDRSPGEISDGLALKSNGVKALSAASIRNDPKILALIRRVLPEVETWREHLTVSIGRATELTGLKDTQFAILKNSIGRIAMLPLTLALPDPIRSMISVAWRCSPNC